MISLNSHPDDLPTYTSAFKNSPTIPFSLVPPFDSPRYFPPPPPPPFPSTLYPSFSLSLIHPEHSPFSLHPIPRYTNPLPLIALRAFLSKPLHAPPLP